MHIKEGRRRRVSGEPQVRRVDEGRRRADAWRVSVQRREALALEESGGTAEEGAPGGRPCGGGRRREGGRAEEGGETAQSASAAALLGSRSVERRKCRSFSFLFFFGTKLFAGRSCSRS